MARESSADRLLPAIMFAGIVSYFLSKAAVRGEGAPLSPLLGLGLAVLATQHLERP